MAWWVVISHAIGIIGIYDTGNKLLNLPLKLITWSGMPVNIFIIVSGFVITHLFLAKQENYSAYITRRFFRIFPIYIFCILLSMSLFYFQQLVYMDISFSANKHVRLAIWQSQDDHFWTHFLLHLSMFHGLVPDSLLRYGTSVFLGPAWSLSLEWQFYLVAPVIIGLMARGVMPLLSTALILYLLGLIAKSGVMGTWNYPAFLLLSIQYFLIGIISRLAIEKFKNQKHLWEIPIVAIVTFSMANVIETCIWVCFFTIALIESGRLHNVPNFIHKLLSMFVLNNIISSLGKWSYSTYLIHIPLMVLVIGSVGFAFGAQFFTPQRLVLIVMASFPIIVAVSWLLYSTIEVGGINLGKQIVNRVRQQEIIKPAEVVQS
jgi:peptidoglycan/LPS O-acetylase OafA/YrhL